MAIIYEANPPKIIPGTKTGDEISTFVAKIKRISKYCDSIHLTEDVLGFSRMSPLDAGCLIRTSLPDIRLTASLRVRDKSLSEVDEFVCRCIETGFSGILVILGDPRRDGRPDSGLVPSNIAQHIRPLIADTDMRVYLSVPADPDFARLDRKKAAKPHGFMTQVVQSVRQVRILKDGLPGFSIIPIVLYPSLKNSNSAKFLNLDMSYADDFAGFVSKIHQIAGDILVTSPADFEGLYGFMSDYMTKYSASG